MHRAVYLLAATALAGCPPPPPTQPQPLAGGSAGCPSAKDVYTAEYVTNEPNHGRSGWVMPLSDQKVDGVAGKPAYQVIDAAAAQAAGVPAAPAHVWLVQPNQAPCQAKVGNYYATAIDIPDAANISYGVELDGCPAPPSSEGQAAEGGEAIALDSAESPGTCRLVTPPQDPIAERVGETVPATGATGVSWKAPRQETPIPVGLVPAIPKHDCTAPGCETLWTVFQIDVDAIPAAWAAAVNWLTVGDAAQTCAWHADTFNGFFIPDSTGKAVKITEGQDHPLILAGVLADGGGPKVLFADGAGEYTAYDLGRGTATVGHHVVWLLADQSAYGIDDHLGPQCNPDAGSAAGSGAPSPPQR
jgi:hypothetical protein